ncbi:MAG: hypothetical protein NTW16_06700 [Bacteroidetes bacterium]|nr:hypothetical protein [Bacteroidota bacterium]
MMETEITCDWIDRYNEDELDEFEKAVFQKQMLVNPLLRSEVYIDASLNRFLLDGEIIDLIGKVHSVSHRNAGDRGRMTYLLIAASVLCLVMIGGLFYLLTSGSYERNPPAIQIESHLSRRKADGPDKSTGLEKFRKPETYTAMSRQKPRHLSLAAKNFQPMEEFELLVGSVTRSNPFKLISPKVNISITAGAEVLFSWQCCTVAEPIYLTILNNRGIPVLETPFVYSCYYRLNTKWFSEGVYYWKIMSDEEMLLMGKLTILPCIKN